jgi:tetraacyldisaccharide 4'-kinase
MFTTLWYRKNVGCYLLLPFSWLYRLALAIKRLSYQLGWRRVTHFPVPVVVVGNITVGGTGKTPLIIALAHFLTANGYKPGIVSRGYGGKATQFPQHVDSDSDPLLVGDEPVLIARRTRCPIVVDPNRVNAVYTLLRSYDCDIVLSDDGLQHTALGRDIEIVVIDGIRRLGNGFCLPAGPLREPATRLGQVNYIVTRGGHAQPSEWEMRLIPGDIYALKQPERILSPDSCTQPIHAVAGIGHPAIFFQQLRELGFTVIEHPFPDHHVFSYNDIDLGDNIIIMTEKDAVKCKKFADRRHWCLPITATCDALNDAMKKQLLQRITTVLK